MLEKREVCRGSNDFTPLLWPDLVSRHLRPRLLAVVVSSGDFQVLPSDPILNIPTLEYPVYREGSVEGDQPEDILLLLDEEELEPMLLGNESVDGWKATWQEAAEDARVVLGSKRFKVASGVAAGLAGFAALHGVGVFDDSGIDNSISDLASWNPLNPDSALAQGITPSGTPTPQVLSTSLGRRFELTADPVGLKWQNKVGETGYKIARWLLKSGRMDIFPSTGSLSATTNSHPESQVLQEPACYMYSPQGLTGSLGNSELLCVIPNIHSATNSPQEFKVGSNASHRGLIFSWLAEPNTSYLLFGGPQTILLGEVSSYDYDTGGDPGCGLVVGIRAGLVGYTDFLCGIPGLANYSGSELTPTPSKTSTLLIPSPSLTAILTGTPTRTPSPSPTLTPLPFVLRMNVDPGVPAAYIQNLREGIDSSRLYMLAHYNFNLDGVLTVNVTSQMPRTDYRIINIGLPGDESISNNTRSVAAHETAHQLEFFLTNNLPTTQWGDWFIFEGTAVHISNRALVESGYVNSLQVEACEVQRVVNIPVSESLRQIVGPRPGLPIYSIAGLAIQDLIEQFGDQVIPAYWRSVRDNGSENAFRIATREMSIDQFANQFDQKRRALTFPGEKYTQWANSNPCAGLWY